MSAETDVGQFSPLFAGFASLLTSRRVQLDMATMRVGRSPRPAPEKRKRSLCLRGSKRTKEGKRKRNKM